MPGINRAFFFQRVRSHLFAGSLRPGQVEGLTFILDVWEASHAASDDRWLAYALGTAFHETAATMQPIHEMGGTNYFFRNYDRRGNKPALAARLGNTHDGDGALFHGRGYVQLTGRSNYMNMGAIFGVNLTDNEAAADRVLGAQLAAKIMFHGMEHGTFTGRRLANYFAGATQDWFNARKIINGLDCAQKIANHAQEFYAAISHTV